MKTRTACVAIALLLLTGGASELCMLSTLKTELGDLRRVVRIVRVTGMVNSAPDFTDQPKVINGCSDLLVAVFGDKGRHARGVLGVASMADARSVGIEMIVEVRD